MMGNRNARWVASATLIGLIVVSLAWEMWLAPARPGGSLLALKALPLCLPLAGILFGKKYTYQYSSMLILFYFAEGVMRLFDADPLSRLCAALATGLSFVFFIACLRYIRSLKAA